jgi:hypothetical protein
MLYVAGVSVTKHRAGIDRKKKELEVRMYFYTNKISGHWKN